MRGRAAAPAEPTDPPHPVIQTLGATLWRALLHPVHPSAAHPSFFAPWAWCELGKQTADTLWYFLTLHQFSWPAAPRQLAVRNSPSVSWRGYFTRGTTRSVPGFPHLPPAPRDCFPSLFFLLCECDIKWGERAAPEGAGRRRQQHFERARTSGRSRHVLSGDARRFAAARGNGRLWENMSGGEIIFQGWLRKSPPEKKLRRYVSELHFRFVCLRVCVCVCAWERAGGVTRFVWGCHDVESPDVAGASHSHLDLLSYFLKEETSKSPNNSLDPDIIDCF